MDRDKLAKDLLEYIESELKKTTYGKVEIELSDNKTFVDVVTEKRKRFWKNEVGKDPAPSNDLHRG